MDTSQHWREFAASELATAAAYIRSFPANAKIYIEEWNGLEWWLVYGDDRDHALQRLSWLAGRTRLRVRLRDFSPPRS
jgi:hypothetical protein